MTAAQAGTAMASDCVDFINEDDARRIFLALFEEIAYAACADADEHLHKIRAGDRKERHVGFAGNGASEQSLACARRSDQQHAFRDPAAELLKPLGLT